MSLPREGEFGLRFLFYPDENPGSESVSGLVSAGWYRDWPEVAVGERWRLEVRLKPPWASVNFHGPDRERWNFANGISASASVRSGFRIADVAGASYPVQRLRSHIERAIDDARLDPAQGSVVRALATADRSRVDRETNRILQSTGTIHLLAISGLHIGLVAAGSIALMRGVLRVAPVFNSGRAVFRAAPLVGAGMATAYALLAGLGVSALRALSMTLVALFVLMAARSSNPFRVLLLALTVVVLFDPYAPLGSGFWYSFLAVLALVWTFYPRTSTGGPLPTAIRAQFSVLLVTLPVNAAWQGLFAPASFLANLLAIPWAGTTLVPPVLLGIAFLPAGDSLAGMAWRIAGLSAQGLLAGLEFIASMPPGLLALRDLSPIFLGVALAGSLILLLPRAVPGWGLGALMLLPLLLPPVSQERDAALRVEVLDVGQGTAVLVDSGDNLVLYDTGPGDGKGVDRVASAIAPAIRALGRNAPDHIVISHGDLDHTGGLLSARRAYPEAPVLGSFSNADDGLEKCAAGMEWRSDDAEYRVLHPSSALPYLKNNSSCVLGIRSGGAGLLLPGDVDSMIERRLLLEGLDSYSLVLAPHHGSASSSSEAFISRVDPGAVIASAGLGNRFGFPKEDVVERYGHEGVPLWSTGDCGGLSVLIDREGRIRARSARRERDRVWRWPAAKECP